MILVLRTMDYLGIDALEAEFIASSISTWAPKISIVVTSIALGLSASLIPNMVEAFTLKKYDDLNHKFNKSLQIILFISLPMCIGISLLASSIWTVFMVIVLLEQIFWLLLFLLLFLLIYILFVTILCKV